MKITVELNEGQVLNEARKIINLKKGRDLLYPYFTVSELRFLSEAINIAEHSFSSNILLKSDLKEQAKKLLENIELHGIEQ